jgi:hypothetical protein
MPKTKNTKSAKSRNNRSRGKPGSSQPARRAPKNSGKRWYFGADNVGIGPLQLGKVGMGSGTKPRSVRSEDGMLTNVDHNNRSEHSRFSRSEVIGLISGSTGFSSREYQINPGNATLFPWLSKIAVLYEKYRFHNLHFRFESLGSGFAAAKESGRCVMVTDYNVQSANLVSAADAQMKDPNVPFRPYENAVLRLDPRQLNPEDKYLRGPSYPAGGDPKSFDGGKFFFVTDGTPNTDSIGNLYVDYDVELFNPQLSEVAIPQTIYTITQRTSDASVPYLSTVDTMAPFATGPSPAEGGLPITYGSGGVWTMPAGNYEIACSMVIDFSAASGSEMYLGYKKDGGTFIEMQRFKGAASHSSLSQSFSVFLQFDQDETFSIYLRVVMPSGTANATANSTCRVALVG